MRMNANSGFASCWTQWVTGLLLILTLSSAAQGRTPAASRDLDFAEARRNASLTDTRGSSESSNHSEITNFFMNYAGDHSLDIATVIEQPSTGHTKYTVQLHLVSGAEQSVILSAPPGGLQVEMRDMTGDKIPNDIILRPALIRWVPTILVNDGHGYFRVAVSGRDPSSFSSNEDLGSRKRDSQTFALMLSSGFKAVHLLNSRRPFDPQSQECLLYSFERSMSARLDHATSSGRAPPRLAAI
jgi:hypothetical protein